MFSERARGFGILFVGTYVPGQRIKDSIADGDDVELKIEEERVLVHNIASIGSRQYRGTIYGFEPSTAIEYKGLSIGQEIEFGEKHIFGCGSA